MFSPSQYFCFYLLPYTFYQVLAAHRILSAPVVATESNDVEHKETAEPHDSIKDVAGFIDIRDVLSSFLQGKS